MKTYFAAALGVALALTSAPASAWRAHNRHEVLPVSDTVFEVVAMVGSSAADYWCGAGDFTYAYRRMRGVQRIYIWRGLGPSATRPGRKSVQFSYSPPPGADTSPTLALSYDDVGDNLSAAMSQQYCFSFDPEDRGVRRP